jgi:outer membrane protein OmpA-like peptidoglycan-associated protein
VAGSFPSGRSGLGVTADRFTPGGSVRRRCWGVGVVATLLTATVGCAAVGDEATASAPVESHVVFVVGARSGVPPVELQGAAARARDVALAQQSQVAVLVVDGEPYELTSEPGQAGDVTAEGIDRAAAAARARTPEADVLTAIARGARSLVEVRGLRTLVVVDSGLSTAGPVNFLEAGVLDAEPSEVADELDYRGLLPDLSGVAVVFQGLGETALPQQPLDRARRAQLAALWTAIAQRAGAVSVEVVASDLEGQPPADLPPVTPVPIDPGYTCRDGVVTIDGGVVSFQPDSDVFLDQEASEAVLRPLAEQIVGQGLEAIIFGTSDSIGDLESQRRRSGLRAQHIADTFIRMGVPIPQLAVEGLGSEFDGFLPDQDEQGRLSAATAALNRKVIIELSTPDGPAQCIF